MCILPTYLYILVNQYAENEDLHEVIVTLSEEDCEFVFHTDGFEEEIFPHTSRLIINAEHSELDTTLSNLIKRSAANKNIWLLNINSIAISPFAEWNFPHVKSMTLENGRCRVISDLTMPKLIYFNVDKLSTILIQNLNMPMLKILRIVDNLLVTLPDLTNLRSLVVLDLSSNEIEYITDIQLPLLESLVLTNNSIAVVPDFNHLPSLKRLILDDNELVNIPDFSNIPMLDELNCSDNRLSSIHRFNKCTNLNVLKISRCNGMDSIPYYSNLKVLEIENVEIENTGTIECMRMHGVRIIE